MLANKMKYKQNRNYYIYALLFIFAFAISKVPYIYAYILLYPYIAAIYWGILFLAICYILPILYVPGRTVMYSRIAISTTVGALIFIGIQFTFGAFLGQIKLSPYDISLEGIWGSMVSVIPMLLAREKIREYAIATTWRKKKIWYIFLPIIIIGLSDISVPNLANMKSIEDISIYLAQNIIPSLAESILLTVVAYYGGAMSSISYILVYDMFFRCFPFLPDLVWLVQSALGIVFPILFGMMIREMGQTLEGTRRIRDDKVTIGYIASLLFTILLAWFSVGVFPVYPSVILTGSMKPIISPGDMILIKKASTQEELERLQVGDIINFNRENINITHRIIEVLEDDAGNISFRTKGDNNQSEDTDIVELEEINGKLLTHIPKIGLPVLIIKGQKLVPEGVVDNVRVEDINTSPK